MGKLTQVFNIFQDLCHHCHSLKCPCYLKQSMLVADNRLNNFLTLEFHIRDTIECRWWVCIANETKCCDDGQHCVVLVASFALMPQIKTVWQNGCVDGDVRVVLQVHSIDWWSKSKQCQTLIGWHCGVLRTLFMWLEDSATERTKPIGKNWSVAPSVPLSGSSSTAVASCWHTQKQRRQRWSRIAYLPSFLFHPVYERCKYKASGESSRAQTCEQHSVRGASLLSPSSQVFEARQDQKEPISCAR